MAAFTPTGVEFVAKGLNGYLSDLLKADKAQGNLGKSAAGITNAFGSLGGTVLNVGATMAKVAAGGVAALGAGLAGFAVSGISQAADLEQKMADIGAVMGKTRQEVEPLKQAILDLSLNPNLKVSATEAAEAVELLARNGLQMEQILGGAAEATVALSNATGAEFGTAADVATDVMAIFNKTAQEMGSVVDGITGVTTSSKFTIDDYALALANSGAIAAGMGVSLEDLNTVISATSSSFASGSDAGTALKTLLQRLANPTTEMTKAMDEYGISLFKDNGEMRDMAEVAGQLNSVFSGTATITKTVGGVTAEMSKAAEQAAKKLPALNNTIEEQQTALAILNNELPEVIKWYGEGSPAVDKHRAKIQKLSNSLEENIASQQEMQAAISAVNNARAETITTTKELTEAEKAELAAVLGGADGSREILALSKLTEKQFEALSDKVNDQGQAFKAAATRVDSFKGAIEIAKSLIQAIQIQVGDALLPTVKKLTIAFTDFASKAGPKVVAFFQSIGKWIDGTAIPAVMGFIKTIQNLATTFQAGGLFGGGSGSFGSAGLLNALGLSPEAVVAVQEIFAKIKATASAFAQTISGVLTPALGGLSSGGILDAISAGLVFLNDHFTEFMGVLAGIGAVAAGGVFVVLVGAITSLITPVTALVAVAGLLGAAWAGNWGNIQGITTSVVTTLMGILTAFANMFTSVILPQVQMVLDNLTTALNAMGLNWSDVWNAILTAVGIVAAGIGVAILAIITVVTSLVVGFTSALATVTGYLTQFGSFFVGWATGVATAFQGMINLVVALINGDWSGAFEAFKMVLDGALQATMNVFGMITTVIQAGLAGAISFLTSFGETVTSIFTDLYMTLVGGSIIPDMVNEIMEWFAMMPEMITNILGGIAETVSNLFSGLFGGGESEGMDFGVTPESIAALSAAIMVMQETFNAFVLSVQTFTLVDLIVLQETFLLLTTMMIQQLMLVLTTGVMPLDMAIILMTTATIPNFEAVTMAALLNIQNQIMVIIATLMQMGTTAQMVAAMIVAAMNQVSAAFEKVRGAIKGVAKEIQTFGKNMLEAAKYAERLAAALEQVFQKKQKLGSLSGGGGNKGNSEGVGFAKGIGFANGTLGLGVTIPNGYPNDSFGPLYVESGEQMLITPRGTSIDEVVLQKLAGLIGQGQGGNTINAPIYTTASPQGIVQRLEVLMSLVE